MTRWLRRGSVVLALSMAIACGGGGSDGAATSNETRAEETGEVVTPPFAVRGAADDLVLTWYDETGPHAATSRAEVPTERRAEVRVDSLEISPDERDPDHVFVADLRTADEAGNYTVRRLPREVFEEHVTSYVAQARTGTSEESGSGDVIIYGASWCGACREAQAYLRARHIPFVEHDIEREPEARAQMQRRAAEAGIPTTSIPIIDFRGTMIRGFDPEALDRAIRETSPDQATGISI